MSLMNLGDYFAYIAQPTARGIDRVLGTDLQHCSSCHQRQARWNQFGTAVYDFFFNKHRNGDNKMQFMVQRQILIEADSPEDALMKTKPTAGDAISMSVFPAPQPPPPTRTIGPGVGQPAKPG
jgi:hypothetical protein